MKRLQIFKPGRHTAMSGATLSFSESDLAATARAYDPALHEAPIVVGHPQVDGPAYGWVKSLAVGDGVLNAEPNQVDPAFAEMVAAGRFKKISASFYLPDSEHNPVPGVHYLRHVGFLGAQAPAVKGLKNASFAAAETGFVEFGDTDEGSSLFQAIRNWFIAEMQEAKAGDTAYAESQRKASELADQQEIDMNEQEKAALKIREDKVAAEAAALATQQADIAKKQAAFAEREKAVKASEDAQRRTEIAAYVGSLVTAGKVLPVHEAGLVSYMAGPREDGLIEFGEGAEKQSKPADAWLRGFLTALPKAVEFAEVGKEGDGKLDASSADSIAQAAVQFQESEKKAGREVSVTFAVQHVTGKKK